MNIREGIKRIYIVLSVLVVVGVYVHNARNRPFSREQAIQEGVERVSELHAKMGKYDPFDSIPLVDNYPEDGLAKDLDSLRRVSTLPDDQVVDGCQTSTFIIEKSKAVCSSMANILESRSAVIREYWTFLVVVTIMTAGAMYVLWRLISWIFAGFSARKANQ